MATDAILDTGALEAIRSLQQPGAEDLVGKIIAMFLEDALRYRDEIAAAIAEHSADKLGAAAHSLKSCAANVGAMQVSALAADLELLGRQGSLDGADARYESLSEAISAARNLLVNHLNA